MASQSASDSATTGAGSTSAPTIREIIPTNRTPEVLERTSTMCDYDQNVQKKHNASIAYHFFSRVSNNDGEDHITHPQCDSIKAQQKSRIRKRGKRRWEEMGKFSHGLGFEDDGIATKDHWIGFTNLSKDHLDAHERKQNSSPLELPLDVEEGVFNDEVQQNEATQLTDQEIALDASSDGSLSSGEQRRDYMMSSGAEDDQTGEGGSMSHGYTYY
ncbi:hypothetical protein Tco_1019079 [Tanacetum coccineum]|uniref:Uncharacterized protein n=1 Tax=Tanacetum coccineum TaxID=301880 RepID=A0ABQ5FWF1_9ASTR